MTQITAPPPPTVINQISDLCYFIRHIDEVERIIADLNEATAKQKAVLEAEGFVNRLKAFEDGQKSEAQAMKEQAAQELAAAQAARVEVESLKQELAGKKVQADDLLKEAEAAKAEAEAIKTDAENRRKQMLDLVSAQLGKATN